MTEPASLPKVVVACTSESRPVLCEALCGLACPVMALSEDDAVRSIDRDVQLVLCTLRFDDSRMLDFIQSFHERFAEVPCVCCRVTKTRLPTPSLRAAMEAARSLGAAEVIDFYSLESALGHEAAISVFRDHVAAHLARQGSPPGAIAG